ncbi:MAG: murein biosynthesis integral membrane protein MurJ [Syntrophomonadaceae bacterium]|nr:murein biosynthesis integral membrane protein MurJ [Syntrophomonadaceae bacterium]MDD3023029.1 murein biosynthesis integral membrane protein MurJ [Syntrophomonadaceae bacterium]
MNKNNKHMARAAVLLMITVILSRILGYGREVALYTAFGQNYMTDAYRAAFSIPDFIYMLLVGGALSAALIPVFSAYIATDREEEGWRSASIVLNYTVVGLVILIIIGYIYTRPLINVLVPGIPEPYNSLAVQLTHIMFVQTFFMALNGLAMGVLNSHHHFFTPALGSLLYNVMIIVLGLALVDQLGIAAFSYGVVLGSVINFLVQIPALRRVGIKYYFSFDFRNEGFKQIMMLMIPVLAGLGAVQLSLFVTQNLASGLAAGTVSALALAQRIMNLPLGIFAVSIAVAIFPTLTQLSARGELEMFKRTSSLGIRAVFLLTIPASLGLMAIGEPVIRLLFEQGKFTASAVAITNEALLYYCIGLFAYSSLQVLNRSFYALKDTISPVIAAIITIAFNILLSLKLVDTMGHTGLALSYSLAGILSLAFLLIILRFKIGKIGVSKIIKSFTISLGASLLMFVAVREVTAYFLNLLTLGNKLELLLGVGLGTLSGALVYGITIYLFKLEESELVLNLIRKKIRHTA